MAWAMVLVVLNADLGQNPPAAGATITKPLRLYLKAERGLRKPVLETRHRTSYDLAVDQFDALVALLGEEIGCVMKSSHFHPRLFRKT